MKRFVLDVQEIWLSNLEHLREHQPDKMFTTSASIATPNKNKGFSGGSNNNEEEDEVEEQNFARGEGIGYRRDVKEIKAYSSQIQSVSQKRIFTKAYHTAKLPSINVMLDYIPDPTPFIEETKPVIPLIESLLSSVSYIPRRPETSPTRHISNQALPFVPIDSPACLKGSIAFHIDRLIPSNDFARITDEAWWRFTLTNSETLKTRIFIATEAAVATFSAQIISSYNEFQQQENIQPQYQQIYDTASLPSLPPAITANGIAELEPGYAPIPFIDGSLAWQGRMKVFSFVERNFLKFVITADLLPLPSSSDVQPTSLHFFTSPLEIHYLLHELHPNIPIIDEEWWLSDLAQRASDVWTPLLAFLRLETSPTNPLLTSITFQSSKPPTGYSECLHHLQTLSCVSELLSTINLHPLPTNPVPTLTISIPNSFKEINNNAGVRAQLKLQEVDGSNYFQQILHYYSRKPASTQPEQRRYLTEEEVAEMAIAKENIEEGENEDEDDGDEEFEEESKENWRGEIPSIPSFTSWQEEGKYFFHRGMWETALEIGPNLSFVSNALNQKYLEVPGGSELGRYGLAFFQDHLFPHLPRTQVAGNYFRDYQNSSTNTIFVNLSLAIDVAKLFPCQLAWEAFPQLPPPAVGDDPPGLLPAISLHRSYLYYDYLNSPIEKRLSNTIIIFTSVAEEDRDYLPRTVAVKPLGYRRHVPTKNEYGFREQIEVSLLFVDEVNDSVVFGITKTGAIPNELKTNSRNIWHSSVAINENINRPRTPKDYIYIILSKEDRGPNIPTSYTTRMKADLMVGLMSSAFKHYEENYQKIKELRQIFHRQLALDAKIEKIENGMKTKEAMIKRKIQDQLQRALEKKLNKATKSELGWRKRFKTSTLLELQGNWEYRRDDRTGLKFFHKIIPEPSLEKYAETCQWEVPTTWESDVLKQLTANGVRTDPVPKAAFKTGSVASSLADDRTYLDNLSEVNDPFAEPASTWAPQDERKGATTGGGMSIAGSLPGVTGKPPLGPGNRSVMSDLDSIRADRSLQESVAATIDTVNLEHIAEQLLSSDEVMRVLAKRLGLPEDQVVPADELSSVFSMNSHQFESSNNNLQDIQQLKDNDGRLNAPREKDIDYIEELEYHSDDDLWSDEEGEEVGDFDIERYLGTDLPSNPLEVAQLRRRDNGHLYNKDDDHSVPSNVPYLNLDPILGKTSNLEIEHNEERYGWRRLPRPRLTTAFLTNALKTHVRGPDITSCNTINAPIFLSPISPVDAIQYIPDKHMTAIESLFIPDAKKDMERSIATLQRNIKREEELSRNLPTDDLLLFGEAKEFTSTDLAIQKQYQKDKAAITDPKEAAKDAAIMAAKATNIAQMEDALAEDIPINTADDFGNTLFILAAQQGSKRMCKFLLRRGANINIQNLTGNTALHYCYAYSNIELADYLKTKGADDSIINVDGLTCYEGLNKESMNKQYADYGEDDYEGEGDGEGYDDDNGYDESEM